MLYVELIIIVKQNIRKIKTKAVEILKYLAENSVRK